jgi:hypothetical protein
MKRAEGARDEWFNRARPMMSPKNTWTKKRLARKEHSDGKDTNHGPGEDIGVSMVFVLPTEFKAPEHEVAQLVLGAKTASFEKPEKLGQYMRPLFVKGHVEGRPM